jgi:hypothetical protein
VVGAAVGVVCVCVRVCVCVCVNVSFWVRAGYHTSEILTDVSVFFFCICVSYASGKFRTNDDSVCVFVKFLKDDKKKTAGNF